MYTMKKQFTAAGRGSRLSLAQITIFREQVQAHFPGTEIQTVVRETQGDMDLSTPLHLVEGKDFFTKDIQEALRSGEADFAVHSMKDVSSMDFFNSSHYAVIDREDPRDVAVFNDNVLLKLQQGEEIVIGTSSPRRSQMAASFLRRALPHDAGKMTKVTAVPVRGNVDARLQQLTDGAYDGIILAAAGMNRLLRYEPSAAPVRRLLQGKRYMVLPLFECPPAAGQGAIVVETDRDNSAAVALLRALEKPRLRAALLQERRYAEQYGYGCSRAFGVFHLDTPHLSFTYASGNDREGQAFTEWSSDQALPDPGGRRLFSAAEYRHAFFSCRLLDKDIDESREAFFVASRNAVHAPRVIHALQGKRVWAAGTQTWLALAEKGIWVEGCADGLGIETILPTLQSPLVQITPEAMQIITHEAGAARWTAEGWHAAGTYRLVPQVDSALAQIIRGADILFWISYRQYEQYRDAVKPGATHACLPGKTAALLAAEGITPVVFPGIKAFKQWQQEQAQTPAPAGV